MKSLTTEYPTNRLLWVLVGSIFFSETLVMLFLESQPRLTTFSATLVDSILLLALLYPVLHFQVLEPAAKQIIALRQAQTALQTSEARSRAITQSAHSAIVSSDGAGNIATWNHGAELIFGYTESEMLGRPLTVLMPERFRDQHAEGMARVGAGGTSHIIGKAVELSGLRRNGSEFPLEMTLAKWQSADSWFFTGIICDISERKQIEDQVHRLAFYDSLTKLPNRRLLNDRLQQSMAGNKRSGCFGALMFLDLDNFKPLNDEHGHEIGDLLLVEAAGRLKACVREMDTVARFGGDEFVVMISELNMDNAESAAQAAIVAEKIRVTLLEPYFLTDKREGNVDIQIVHHCSASIGVALFGNHETNQNEIIKRADTTMYKAKRAGRNLVMFWDP